MRIIYLPIFYTVLLDIVAWFIIHMGVSLFALKLPDSYFLEDSWLYRARGWENGGKFWDKYFKVKSWKGSLPDGSLILGKGFAKKKLARVDSQYLQQFAMESRRAELTHYLVMLPALLFFLWNSVGIALLMIPYALIANVPCIIAQRYNRPRLLKLAKREKTKP